MANLVYQRVATDQQSTARQNLVLDEAGIEDPVAFEEDPGTSSRLHPLPRQQRGMEKQRRRQVLGQMRHL